MVRVDKEISRNLKKGKRGVKKALGKQGTKALNTVVKKTVNTGRRAVKGVARSQAQVRALEKALPKDMKKSITKAGRKIKYTI